MKYLESTTEIQALRIHELEAALMMIFFREVNQLNNDYIYIKGSTILHHGMPFSESSIEYYKRLISGN